MKLFIYVVILLLLLGSMSFPVQLVSNITAVQQYTGANALVTALNAASDGDEIHVYYDIATYQGGVNIVDNNIKIIGITNSSGERPQVLSAGGDVLIVNGAENVLIANLVIRDATSDYGIHVQNTSINLKISNCIISNNDYGIFFDSASSTNATIIDCTITKNNIDGIYIVANNTKILNSEISFNGTNGVNFDNSLTGCIISNSTFISNNTSDNLLCADILFADSDASTNTIINSIMYVSNGNNGISIGSGYNDIISNTVIGGSHGIYLKGTSVFSNNVVSNLCYDQSDSGIRIESAAIKNYIAYNEVHDVPLCHGIMITGKSNIAEQNLVYNCGNGINIEKGDYNDAISNILSNNQKGIQLRDDAQNNNILGNTIISNNIAGIYFVLVSVGIMPSYNLVSNNTIYGVNQPVGIHISDAFSNDIVFNKIYSNSSYGIELINASTNNIISNNIVYDNDIGNIYAGGSELNDNKIVANTVYGSASDYGIYITNVAGLFVSNNTITNIGGDGIYIVNTSDISVLDNTINANQRGIKLFNASLNEVHENVILNNSSSGIFIDANANSTNNDITKNTMLSNNYGVYIANNSYGNNVSFNNIYDNTTYNVYASVNGNVFLTNWWGTSIYANISPKISGITTNNYIPYRLGPINIHGAVLPPDGVWGVGANGRPGKIVVNWTDTLSEAGYKIYRSTNDDYLNYNSAVPYTNLLANISAFTDVNVEPYITYYYRITAFDSNSVSNETWYSDVGGSKVVVASNIATSAVFYTIQDAIDAASGGDTIVIFDGTYNEQVTINNKMGLIIQSYEFYGGGLADRGKTTITGGFIITNSTSIDIVGFTFAWADRGIQILDSSSMVNISDVDIKSNNIGVYINNAADTHLYNSDISYNTNYGIYIDGNSTGNNIYSAMIEGNGKYGIFISGDAADQNNLYSLTISANATNIAIIDADSNIIRNSYIQSATSDCGIYLDGSATYNRFLTNYIGSQGYGVYITSGAINNEFCLNNFDNWAKNVYSLASGNTFYTNWWNTSVFYDISNTIHGISTNNYIPYRLGYVDIYQSDQTPPGIVTITNCMADSSGIVLKWANLTDEAGYKIYRSTNNNFYDFDSSNPYASLPADVCAFTDTMAAYNTTYYYAVTAFDSQTTSNESWFSDLSNATIVVSYCASNIDKATHYSTIQGALNDASSGDTIVVFDGNYGENIVIINTNIVLMPYAFYLSNDNTKVILLSSVVFSNAVSNSFVGFGIYNSTGNAISLYSSHYNTIKSNIIISNNYSGIYMDNSSHNFVLNNTLENNTIFGGYSIGIISGDYNYIGNNTISAGSSYGVFINSKSNSIISNLIMNLSQDGIHVSSDANSFISNEIRSSSVGIYIDTGRFNYVYMNSLISNSYIGVLIGDSISNTVVSNTILGHIEDGIQIYSGAIDTIANSLKWNTIYNNTRGIYLLHSQVVSNYILHNNIYANSNGIYIDDYAHNNFIEYNIITNNTNGIAFNYSYDNYIMQNNILSNTNGLYVYNAATSDYCNLNNIYDNICDATNLSTTTVHFTNNWWGSVNSNNIDSKVGNYITFSPYRLLSPVDISEGADNTPPSRITSTTNIVKGPIVELYWSIPSYTNGFKQYNIYRSTVNDEGVLDATKIIKTITDISITNYEDTPGSPGNYYYWITTYDDASHTNESWYSIVSHASVVASDWVHNISNNTWYSDISSAIAGANDGHLIVVYPKTYNENIIINKEIKILADDYMAYSNNTTTKIIANNFSQPTINITADNAVVYGFNISGGKHGIKIGNNITNVGISSCYIHDNSDYGIYMNGNSSTANIYTSLIANNSVGIYADNGNQLQILGNDIVSNTVYGVENEGCDYMMLYRNNIKYNNYGVGVFSDVVNGVENNIYSNNGLNITNNVSTNLYFANNWWGTTVYTNIIKTVLPYTNVILIPFRLYGEFDTDIYADNSYIEVSNFFALSVGDNNVILTWDKVTNDDFKAYRIYRVPTSIDITDYTLLLNVTSNELIYTINDRNTTAVTDHVLPSGDYAYYLTVIDTNILYPNESWYNVDVGVSLNVEAVAQRKYYSIPSISSNVEVDINFDYDLSPDKISNIIIKLQFADGSVVDIDSNDFSVLSSNAMHITYSYITSSTSNGYVLLTLMSTNEKGDIKFTYSTNAFMVDTLPPNTFTYSDMSLMPGPDYFIVNILSIPSDEPLTNSGVGSWIIEVSEGGQVIGVFTNNISDLSYTVTNLKSFTPYSISMWTIDKAGNISPDVFVTNVTTTVEVRISSISKTTLLINTPDSLVIKGSGFVGSLNSYLSNNIYGIIEATNINVADMYNIECFYNLSNSKVSTWDLVVESHYSTNVSIFILTNAVKTEYFEGSAMNDLSRAIVGPNPYTGQNGINGIYFDKLTSSATIEIYTINGKLVKTLKEDNGDGKLFWDLEQDNIQNGLYICRIYTGNSEKVIRLMIMR